MKHTVNSTADNAPQIATKVVALWADHEEALDKDALPYLDSLLSAIVARKPIDPESLITKLHEMVPGLHRGTARRLVNLKFGNPRDSEILAVAA